MQLTNLHYNCTIFTFYNCKLHFTTVQIEISYTLKYALIRMNSFIADIYIAPLQVGQLRSAPNSSVVPRQLVYKHFVYDTSSTDISSTDISSTIVYQRVA